MIHEFNYNWSTQRYIGSGCIDKVGQLLKKDGATTVMLHFGGGEYLYTTGLMARVQKSLTEAGLTYVSLPGVVPNPRLSLVRKGIELGRREGVDYILSIGGGSAVDSAKAISLGMYYEGDVWDLFDAKGKVPDDAPITPIASIVTYPATGAEAGWASVIRDECALLKQNVRHPNARPHYTFLDPQYTVTLPRKLMVNGICDMMSHHCDRYMTDDSHFGLFDHLLESTMHYLHSELAPVVLNPETDNLADRTELMALADIACDEFIAWGRHKENASHNIAHQIGALYDTIHGSTLTIIYASWMRYVYKDNLPRMVRWAKTVWDVPADFGDDEAVALEGISRLEKWFRSLDMPVSFSDMGLTPTDEEIESMAQRALKNNKNGYLGVVRKLYKEDIVQILKNSR